MAGAGDALQRLAAEIARLTALVGRHVDDEEKQIEGIDALVREQGARREREHSDACDAVAVHNDKLVALTAHLETALDLLEQLVASARGLWTDEIRKAVRQDTRHDIRNEVAVLTGEIRDEIRTLMRPPPKTPAKPDEQAEDVTALVRVGRLAVRHWPALVATAGGVGAWLAEHFGRALPPHH